MGSIFVPYLENSLCKAVTRMDIIALASSCRVPILYCVWVDVSKSSRASLNVTSRLSCASNDLLKSLCLRSANETMGFTSAIRSHLALSDSKLDCCTADRRSHS